MSRNFKDLIIVKKSMHKIWMTLIVLMQLWAVAYIFIIPYIMKNYTSFQNILSNWHFSVCCRQIFKAAILYPSIQWISVHSVIAEYSKYPDLWILTDEIKPDIVKQIKINTSDKLYHFKYRVQSKESAE